MRPLLDSLPAALSTGCLQELIRRNPRSVWLDSSAHTSEEGRRSILGLRPFMTFTTTGVEGELAAGDDRRRTRGNPWDVLAEILAPCTVPGPFPMAGGGAMGYIGYDLGRHLERLPSRARREEGLPEAYLAFFDLLVVVDHACRETWLVSAGRLGEQTAKPAYTRLKWLRCEVRAASAAPAAAGVLPERPGLHAYFSRSSYCAAVRKAQDYIAAGDIYQVNLSQRFRVEYPGDPLGLYLRLREHALVPFGAYMRVGEDAVLCASPERFLRVRGTSVETCPIKGTRPRGVNRVEDERLAAELGASEKDRAELAMVVDLERNDLARVCLPGTVRVPKLCRLESYTNVHHLVATVIGALKPGLGAVDLLRAAFPGGSVTGVPKIRAMEIIEELEPVRRGIYTGCLGYVGFDGDADLNITIRTGWTRSGVLSFQVGGAVTSDSDPDLEYEETWHKAAGLLGSLGYENFGEVVSVDPVLD